MRNVKKNENVLFLGRNGNLKTLLSVGGWNFGSSG